MLTRGLFTLAAIQAMAPYRETPGDWWDAGLFPLVAIIGFGILVAILAAMVMAAFMNVRDRRRFRGPTSA
jgi:hypothetical protein